MNTETLTLSSSYANASRANPVSWLWKKRETAYVWLFLLVAWQIASRFLPLGDNPLIPAPAVVLRALADSWQELLKGTWSSILILVPGFVLATVLAVVSGLWVGTSGKASRSFLPFSRVAAPIPPTVYIPYAIAILPTFRLSAIFVVFIGAFWPIFHSTVTGAHTLEVGHRDNARILGLGGLEYYRRVVFPASLPHIFSGMGVGLSFAFILLTVAELFGANAGLGRFVQYYADYADYPRMVAGILYTGVVTFVAMTLLEAARKRALFWLR